MSLIAALHRRFKAPEWATFREVTNATGAQAKRYADMVAMNLWPSRGMEIVGIECKDSRSDWARERDNPEKAEAVMQYCDRWYLAISKGDIIKPGELPPTWGLLVLNGETLREQTPAPKLPAKEPTRAFVGALLRRAYENPPGKAELSAAHVKGWQEGLDEGKKLGGYEYQHKAENYDKLVKELQAFEQASGIVISRYTDGKDLGMMIRLLESITDGDGSSSKLNALCVEARRIREHAEYVEAQAQKMIAMLHPARKKAGAA